jgi:hypothetical protein
VLYLTIIFLIFVVSQFAALSSAYRMDRYLKDLRLFPKVHFKCKYKDYLFLSDRKTKKSFLLYSIVLNFAVYIEVVLMAVLYIVAMSLNNGDLNFIASVILFVFMVIDVLVILFEMVMLTFFDKKTYGDD